MMNVGKYVLSLSLMGFLLGCVQTVAFRGSQEVPAALGEAKVSTDDNGNAVVKVEIEHLAPPENLSPPKQMYVVWAQTPNGRFVNLGQMTVGENRVGQFNGVTALKEFRLVVTGEDIPATITPSKQEILTTEVFTAN
ncbi:MAG: hypothetical protein ACXWYD_13680 [Candidatus Binatia bacterium]